LSLLRLAFRILLLAFLLQTFHTEQVTGGLFSGADGLVPRASLAVLIVRRDARRRDGDASNIAAGVGEGVLRFGLSLAVFCLSLRMY
jgi:hypothetical protein